MDGKAKQQSTNDNTKNTEVAASTTADNKPTSKEPPAHQPGSSSQQEDDGVPQQSSPADQEARVQLYTQTREDLLKRMLSNSENFDRAVLTLSSAALGLSVTFIKNIVDLSTAIYVPLLAVSWVMFVSAIIVTLVSFHISQWAIRVQLNHAEEYYIHRKDEFLTKINVPNTINEWSGYLSAVVFILAIICFVLFVSLNLNHKEGNMSDQKRETNVKKLQEGATVPGLQAVPGGVMKVEGGAAVPSMQAGPTAPKPRGGGSADQSGGNQGGDSGGGDN